MKFIDFEELPLLIELAFSPLNISIVENYIAYNNKDSMHLFKITECMKEQNDAGDNDMSFLCEYSFTFMLIIPNTILTINF